MSDDEDYMSDKFLLSIENKSSKGLIVKPAEKRAMTMMKRKAEAEEKMREQNKSRKVMEIEKREEGLSSAISTNNKGFEMMMKMGYKPGQGVGKNLSGRSEPVPVNLKVNRLGLGKINEKKEFKKQNLTAKLENMNTEDFRDRVAAKKSQQLMEGDLFKSQKSCYQLDLINDIDKPVEPWYWPEIKIKNPENLTEEEDEEKDKEEEDDEQLEEIIEIPTSEKLDILTDYLRTKYNYCIWCGAAFNDQQDIQDNCPGNTRNDH